MKIKFGEAQFEEWVKYQNAQKDERSIKINDQLLAIHEQAMDKVGDVQELVEQQGKYLHELESSIQGILEAAAPEELDPEYEHERRLLIENLEANESFRAFRTESPRSVVEDLPIDSGWTVIEQNAALEECDREMQERQEAQEKQDADMRSMVAADALHTPLSGALVMPAPAPPPPPPPPPPAFGFVSEADAWRQYEKGGYGKGERNEKGSSSARGSKGGNEKGSSRRSRTPRDNSYEVCRHAYKPGGCTVHTGKYSGV